MKVMATNLKKYLKLFLLFTRLNHLKAMEYRVNFWTALLSPLLYSVGYLIFINVLLAKTPNINGWNFDQMILLFACGQLFYYSAWVFYRAALETFASSVRDGSFDFVLKTPINSRFNVSFREQRLNIIIPFILSIFVLIYSARNMDVSLISIVLFLILFILGLIIYYNFIFTLITLTFWVIDSDELLWFGDDSIRFGSYPMSIYPTFFGLLLLTLIPIMLVIYVPATAFMGILDYKLAILSPVMVVVSWKISQFIWTKGLKEYSSASS